MTTNTQVQAETTFQLAFEQHRRGEFGQALALYQRTLELQPQHVRAWHLMGVAALQTNQAGAATQFISRAISLAPKEAEFRHEYGNALAALDLHDAALASFAEAIALRPDYVDAYFNRGNTFFGLGRFESALADYDRAIGLQPDHAGAHNNRGLALLELDRPEAALASYDRALGIDPRYAEAHCNRGNLLLQLERLEEALSGYERAIAIQPDMAETHMNRGIVLRRMQRHEAALASYDRAIRINPNYAMAHSNRGVVLKELKAWDAALASYDRAIVLNPQMAEAHLNRAELMKELKQWPEALSSYERAVAIDPGFADAHYGRGETQRLMGRYSEAAASLKRALELKPDMKCLLGTSLHVGMYLCEWDGFAADLARLTERVERGEPACLPHPFSALCGSAALQKKVAEIWVREEWAPDHSLPPLLKYGRHERIRIGYFSADFYNHPVSTLTAELFELHDRRDFEVTAFSSGPDTGDPMRVRLQNSFDRFIDVRGRPDKGVALLSRSMELDIAVDLGGFTGDARLKVFALRAAPLQVSYLGYLGTTAAPYMDYLIADPVIIPAESRPYYTEKILYLPSYQANDSKRSIAERRFTREELGLPPNGFVFCCFNANYKITPCTFAGWMRILQQVSGAVLFLYADNEVVQGNLRREAKRRGVDPSRLVFGQALPASEYLARYRVADLFLDTTPYNAGTTASDALWAGLPVLTCVGEAFASRVAASLLSAIGLPELIAWTQSQYERTAIDLGNDPARLAVIKQRLAGNRMTTPLFDTPRFTKSLERAYARIYEHHRAGLPPENLHSDIES